MASYPFVLNSQEFKCFSRPQANGDIEKILSKLPAESNQQILEKLMKALDVEDEAYDILRLNDLCKVSDEFKHFATQMVPLLRAM